MKKQRPTLIDEFRNTLTPEQDAELVRMVEVPNIAVPEVYNWLVSQGFKGSLSATYTWYHNHKKAGELAEQFNQLLKEYEGVAAEKVLQKLIVVLGKHLDLVLTKIITADETISPTNYLRTLPQLVKELRCTVELTNKLQFVRERRDLELAASWRVANELKAVFKNTAFELALNEGIRAVMLQIEQEG